MPLRLVTFLVYRLAPRGRDLLSVDIEDAAACPTCQGTRRVRFGGKAHPYTIPCPRCGGTA